MGVRTRAVKLVRLREGVFATGEKAVGEDRRPPRVPHLVDVTADLGSPEGVMACCGAQFAPGTLLEVPWIELLPHKACLRRSVWPSWKIQANFAASVMAAVPELPAGVAAEREGSRCVRLDKDGVFDARGVRVVVGRVCRRVRDALGWSRPETVARMPSGISDRTLLAYERGLREPSISRFVELCRVLGAEPGTVLSAALRLDPSDVEQTTLIVDLPELIRDATPAFDGVRTWAQRKILENDGADFVELAPVVVRELAAYIGCSHYDLASYLVSFAVRDEVSETNGVLEGGVE